MNLHTIRFFFRLLALTFVIAAAGAFCFHFFLKQYYSPVFPLLLVFFFGFTFLFHAIQIRMAGSSFLKYTRTHLIITILRLFTYLAVAILYMAFYKENLVGFVVVLLLLYLFFTGFEVVELARFNRKMTEK